MKQKNVTLINLIILCILCIGNGIFIYSKEINNDSILMLVFSIIFFILYILGALFPNTTLKFIHQLKLKGHF